MLFCLAIHPLTEKLTSELVVFYLDDGTFGGRVGEVLQDLRTVECAAEDLGLQLNRGKSEVIRLAKVSACGTCLLGTFMASISACKLLVENRLFLYLQAVDNDTRP